MNIKKPSKSKAQLKSKKKSVNIPTKGPSKARVRSIKAKKKLNPVPVIFAILVIVGGFFVYGPIMKFIEESNRPIVVQEVKKEAPKKKIVKKVEAPKPKVVEVKKVEVKRIEAPKEELFEGVVKHYTFNGIVKDKCFSCHGAEGKDVEGKFDFKKFLASGSTNAKSWKIIYNEIAKNNMPPEEEKPLSIEEKEVLLAEIKKIASNVVVDNKTRALTPNEIENTLVDLFAVDKSVYNPFSKLYQNYSHTEFFTTQEDIITPYYLDDLYTSLEDAVKSYVSLRTQTKPLNLAVNLPSQVHRTFNKGATTYLRWEHANLMNEIHFKDRDQAKDKQKRSNKEEGPETDTDETLQALTLPAGTYKLSFDAIAQNIDSSKYNEKKYGKEVINLYKNIIPKDAYSLPVDFYIAPPGQADAYAKTQQITTVDISSKGKQRYTVKFTLNRKGAITYRSGAGLPYDGKVAQLIAQHRKKGADRKDQELVLEKEMRVANYPFAQVKFTNISIKGPLNVKVNDYSLKDDEKLNDRAIREKFKNLHEDAAIKNNTVYAYIFSKLKQTKMDEEESFRVAMLSFFLSPDFLTVGNDKKDKQSYARFVSYSLHKSHPSKDFIDQFTQAQKSKDPEKFAEWLANHANFKRFLDSFSYQWLEMEEILAATPEEDKFGTFHENNFFDAYQVEVSRFLLHLFTQNRPVKELVTADYSFVNDDLKSFYESGNGRGRYRQNGRQIEKKQVDVADFKKHIFSDKRRGGILSQGAFLTATGNGVDGLPIKRSTWILENLLDAPLPPPPEEIDLTSFESEHSKGLKKMLEAHSQNPACYSCHKRIDPFAIIMDYYDTMGGVNSGHARDAVMINNKKIENITDLKEYIGSNDEVLARSFTKKLLEYTLGRQLYIQDEPKLNSIIDENRESGFKTRNLLSSILKNFFL